MKIWVDLTNSPHVNFFARMIRELSGEHEFVLTCRPLANTIDLLDMQGFSYEVVGKHYGSSSIKKAGGFFARCLALHRALRRRKVDVAISHSSFYSPLVARLLGVPSIYINDNEHAQGNRPAFIFASTIMVPEFLSDEALQRQWARPNKVARYPGVKEGVYLWPLGEAPRREGAVHSDRPTIVVRPEPWAAQYYRGRRDFLDETLLGLSRFARVILLPRGEEQAQHYRSEKFDAVEIPDKPLSLEEFIDLCDVFVGAGGTMTREAAVLGIPTVSIYQDELLAVDRFLVQCGAMVHNPDADAAYIRAFLADATRAEPDKALLDKGRSAYEQIRQTLLAAAAPH